MLLLCYMFGNDRLSYTASDIASVWLVINVNNTKACIGNTGSHAAAHQ